MLNDSRRLQGDIRLVIASYKNQFDLLNTEFGKQSVVPDCGIWSVIQNTSVAVCLGAHSKLRFHNALGRVTSVDVTNSVG